jgi:nitroreductase
MPEPELRPEIKECRANPYSINPLIINRWSPRSYLPDKPVAEADLNAVLDAAHWAPSSSNGQPWHFIVARTSEDLDRLRSCLNSSNRVWADRAPVLLAVLSKPSFDWNSNPNRWHAFDTGTAWGFLALEASRRGLAAHGMGGFSEKKLRELFGVPAEWGVWAVVALGYQGPKEQLPPELQEREKPSLRKALEEICCEGKFNFGEPKTEK